ncbi:hypothetical protein [Agromyces ramosus]|uniref:Uncharacterized protein n=1 Tax=Agromyces ramosus TaxID=33879 RepID=A0ABU0R9V1_9MICO|nr:hypothetical protein [Agromyces ramosus]MDQ0894846.1 hypothetical protein [Agromyces ramosus]
MHKLIKTFGITAGLSGAMVAGIGIAAIVGLPAASAGVAASAADQVKPASSVLAALGSSGRPIDALPERDRKTASEDHGESGIDLSSTRFLGKNGAASYWAGEDYSGNVCLVVSLSKGGMSSGCTKVEDFISHGVALKYEVPGSGEYSEAYLFPDGVEPVTPDASLRPLGTNLLVGDTRGMSAEKRANNIQSKKQPDFVMGLLEPAGMPNER